MIERGERCTCGHDALDEHSKTGMCRIKGCYCIRIRLDVLYCAARRRDSFGIEYQCQRRAGHGRHGKYCVLCASKHPETTKK